MKKILQFTLCIIVLFSCRNNNTENTDDSHNASSVPTPAQLAYNIINTFPHDTTSFTQGLFFYEGNLFESTGESGTSWLLKVNVKDGKKEKLAILPEPLFGEGSTVLNNKIYQLTWMDHKVFIYDANTYKLIKELTWPMQGWGLTTDSTHLIISTGSSDLYIVDPETFNVIKKITVNDNYGPVASLNELEYANGYIYANVFETNNIVKIDPSSGNVVGTINLTALLSADPMPLNGREVDMNNVLNGIAYNPQTNTFFVTGKRWSKMFEIKLQ